MKNLLVLTSVMLTAVTLLATHNVALAAGSATFLVAASPSSLTVGSTTTVALYENGTNVNVVTGTYTYDSSKLQFVSASCVGAFPTPATAPTSSSVSCFSMTGAVNGSQQFASIVFKSIAAGNANVTVTGSQIASAGVNIWNGNTVSATIAIANPVEVTPTLAPTVAATAQPANNQNGKTSSTSTTKPTATATPAPTTDSQVMGTEITNDQATVSATPVVSVTPVQTETQSALSKLPWLAGSAVVLIAAAGVAFWLWRKYLRKS